MARIVGCDARGLFARFVYFMLRRWLGRVPEPIRVVAHHGEILRGRVAMERALQRSKALPGPLKSLVELRVAMRVGCPF